MPQIEVADLTLNEKGLAYFDVVVVRQGVQVTRDQSKYELCLMVEVDSGPAKGKHAYGHLWLTPKAIGNTHNTLAKAFSFDGGVPDVETTEHVRQYLMALKAACMKSQFVGEEVSVAVGVEEWEGKQSVKVKWVNPRGGGAKSIDEDDWADLFAAHGIGEGRVAAVQPEDDASLPF